jgi:hypothetical protein
MVNHGFHVIVIKLSPGICGAQHRFGSKHDYRFYVGLEIVFWSRLRRSISALEWPQSAPAPEQISFDAAPRGSRHAASSLPLHTSDSFKHHFSSPSTTTLPPPGLSWEFSLRLILVTLPQPRHDLLEILEERYGRCSTMITSQLPVDRWHEIIGDPTMPTPSWIVSFTTPTASNSPAKACAGPEANRTRRLDQTSSPVTQSLRSARLATRAASFRYGGRHHSGIPGGIIPLYPGDFVGIRKRHSKSDGGLDCTPDHGGIPSG